MENINTDVRVSRKIVQSPKEIIFKRTLVEINQFI